MIYRQYKNVALWLNKLLFSICLLAASEVATVLATEIGNRDLSQSSLLSLSTENSVYTIDVTQLENQHPHAKYPHAISKLLTFSADGLKQHALLLTPDLPMPKEGWPTILFLHGFHPNPEKYGVIKDNVTKRPGDYYMSFPLSYVRAGYQVVVPDYRGHNSSQGFDFTGFESSQLWYLRDVIVLTKQLLSYDKLDQNRLFIVGHSMGASIALKTVAFLSNKITAASFWALAKPTSMTDFKYSNWQKVLGNISSQPFLELPMIFHHGLNDKVTPIENVNSANEFFKEQKTFKQVFIYETDKHLFINDNYQLAIERDLAFFQQASKNNVIGNINGNSSR